MRYNLRDMTNEEIARSCEDAADILERHWIKGSWYSQTTDDGYLWGNGAHYCLEGAMAAALGMDATLLSAGEGDRALLAGCPTYDAVLGTLNQHIVGLTEDDTDDPWYGSEGCYSPGGLPSWNDEDWRTEAEVLDLLRATAKRVLTDPHPVEDEIRRRLGESS